MTDLGRIILVLKDYGLEPGVRLAAARRILAALGQCDDNGPARFGCCKRGTVGCTVDHPLPPPRRHNPDGFLDFLEDQRRSAA